MTRRALLLSNSTLHGGGYLDHAEDEIRDFLGASAVRVLFLPYAMRDRDAHTRQARERFAAMEYALHSAHEAASPPEAAAGAEAVFVGGGNTFQLLDCLHRLDWLPVLRRRVAEGVPYIGSSAGSNVACPTIKTTKDMPILQPPSFEALNLVDFQISPHFQDPDPGSTHMGETQEERIRQYLEENDRPVAGLREGAILRVEGETVLLKGRSGARLFRPGAEPEEVLPGADVTRLLSWSPA